MALNSQYYSLDIVESVIKNLELCLQYKTFFCSPFENPVLQKYEVHTAVCCAAGSHTSCTSANVVDQTGADRFEIIRQCAAI